ncbi:ATP-dependent DNA ligase [Methylobrevis pamukkalensis]|uniref:ATP-dependent DNA ligase n=1 Tax=Methylobrevis pamukkalensis TaxID=1439726 RepID=A0A1E3H3K7_9HYPH|nr:ATP-dependent DNA ligase [Methylobrevis pamukkalensis]
MKAFAALLERLVLTPQRTVKLRLLADYFRNAPDPDRGYALAAICGTLDLKALKPALLRELVGERVDPVLFGYSYDYVGDLAETIALIWPIPDDVPTEARGADLALGGVVERLRLLGRGETAAMVRDTLDRLGPSERFAFLKLGTGGLRVGVSGRLAMQALASLGEVEAADLEALWHGLGPPYTALFAFALGTGPRPEPRSRAVFRPVMLSTAITDATLPRSIRPTSSPSGNGTASASRR